MDRNERLRLMWAAHDERVRLARQAAISRRRARITKARVERVNPLRELDRLCRESVREAYLMDRLDRRAWQGTETCPAGRLKDPQPRVRAMLDALALAPMSGPQTWWRTAPYLTRKWRVRVRRTKVQRVADHLAIANVNRTAARAAQPRTGRGAAILAVDGLTDQAAANLLSAAEHPEPMVLARGGRVSRAGEQVTFTWGTALPVARPVARPVTLRLWIAAQRVALSATRDPEHAAHAETILNA